MEYNRMLNSAMLGWALTLIAILLNVLTWVTGLGGYRGYEILGIVAGVLVLSCEHFSEGLYAMSFMAGYDARKTRALSRHLSRAAVLLCILSYLSWLYAVTIH